MGINSLLDKSLAELTHSDIIDIVSALKERISIEFAKQDKSGIYGLTQYQMCYNSNRIEGSTLTENQTAFLFQTGTLPQSDELYRAKDIEEASGHFMMFNTMLQSYDAPLSEDLIKEYHYMLKSGVFEDRANGYKIGDYKDRANIVGTQETCPPDKVHDRMVALLEWYNQEEVTISTLAEFHLRYERIYPFQDGNGRTGRLILYKECLRNNIIPFIVHEENKPMYMNALTAATGIEKLVKFFEKEQLHYFELLIKFLKVYS